MLGTHALPTVHGHLCCSDVSKLLTWALQGPHGAPSTVGAVPIAIHVVVDLAVVHNLAVGGADPVCVAPGCSRLRKVRPCAWPSYIGVGKGAVQPVDACVPHAHNLTQPVEPCKRHNPAALRRPTPCANACARCFGQKNEECTCLLVQLPWPVQPEAP